MGQFMPYLVETFDERFRVLGEFRRFDTARAVARRAVIGRVSLATIKDRQGVLVFAVDPDREWDDSEGLDEWSG